MTTDLVLLNNLLQYSNSTINIVFDGSGSMTNIPELIKPYIRTANKTLRIFFPLYLEEEGVDMIESTSLDFIGNTYQLQYFGACLQKGVDYVIENYNDSPLIIITDGGYEPLNLEKYNFPVLLLDILPSRKYKYSTAIFDNREIFHVLLYRDDLEANLKLVSGNI